MNFIKFLILLFIISCGTDEAIQEVSKLQLANSNFYFKSAAKIKINVYYEPGAEPFTGSTNNGYPYWSILENNLEALFQYRSSPPTLEVPKSINEMNQISEQNKNSWTLEDVMNLHKNIGLENNESTTADFHLYFVNGYASQSNAIIGFNITGYNVIAIFKSNINSINGNITKRFVEQSTIVHEMGHAVGLVNIGVPLSSSHQDTSNGAHTNNSDCVMYWLNEGASDLVKFVQKIIVSGSTVMWGPEVLQDVQSISE